MRFIKLNTKLNTFHLKLLALFFMVIDHVATFFIPISSPDYFAMRIVGRIAAPLFWFCFAEGFRHTSNRLNYICRLGIAAGIMGIVNEVLVYLFDISSTFSAYKPNIFLTMFFMAIAILLFEKVFATESNLIATGSLLLGIATSVLAGFICEYGWFAVTSILFFYFIKHKAWKLTLFGVSCVIISLLEPFYIQLFMILSIFPMAFYSNEKPKHGWKWFFYVFYPAHIWILVILSSLI